MAGLLRSTLKSVGLVAQSPPPPPPDVNELDEKGWTKLNKAVYKGDLDTVKDLLANPDVKILYTKVPGNPGRLYNALHFAAHTGNLDMIKILLNDDRIDINWESDSDGRDMRPKEWQGRFLIRNDMGGKVLVPEAWYPWTGTALHIAVMRGHRKVVKELLANPQIDKNIKDSDEKTASSYAQGFKMNSRFVKDSLKSLKWSGGGTKRRKTKKNKSVKNK